MKPRALCWVLALFAACATAAAAEDSASPASGDGTENFTYHTVTTKEGLTFRVPEDMPIENRGGILAPIPFDEYMYGKFKQMAQRLDRMQAQLDRIEKLLSDLRLGAPSSPSSSTSPAKNRGALQSG
jgi:hypothetical protein